MSVCRITVPIMQPSEDGNMQPSTPSRKRGFTWLAKTYPLEPV
jgi:hypothetical protein